MPRSPPPIVTIVACSFCLVVVITMMCTNVAELIEVLFGIWTRWPKQPCIRWGLGSPQKTGHFWAKLVLGLGMPRLAMVNIFNVIP